MTQPDASRDLRLPLAGREPAGGYAGQHSWPGATKSPRRRDPVLREEELRRMNDAERSERWNTLQNPPDKEAFIQAVWYFLARCCAADVPLLRQVREHPPAFADKDIRLQIDRALTHALALRAQLWRETLRTQTPGWHESGPLLQLITQAERDELPQLRELVETTQASGILRAPALQRIATIDATWDTLALLRRHSLYPHEPDEAVRVRAIEFHRWLRAQFVLQLTEAEKVEGPYAWHFEPRDPSEDPSPAVQFLLATGQ